ncbi:MAG: glycosyltransferase family 39 protein [Thioploca sp.]|nr:glycosyltransferase family 39 protein [Thioploca sp.]
MKFSQLLPVAKPHNFYFWILFIALLLRVLWAIVAVPIVPVSDCNAYDTFAQNLANGYGYGWTSTEHTAHWPPGTSFVYSIFYRLFGHTYVPIIILNLVLGIVIIWCSMQLAERWFNQQIAWLTGLILTLWPVTIQFTTVLSSELLFMVLFLIALIIWLNEPTHLWLRALLVGLVLAAACYVRSATLFIPFLLLLFRWVNTREILRSVAAIIVVFIIISLLITPWSIRNTRLYGQFVLMSTNTGVALWIGNNPNAYGGHMSVPPELKEKMAGMNQAQSSAYLKALAIDYIKQEPLKFVTRSFKKLLRLHMRDTIGVAWNKIGLSSRYGTGVLLPLKIISQGYWLTMLGLALIGIILLGNRQGWLTMIVHPVVIIWGYFAFGHAVTEIDDRYHFYSIPMIAILAALVIAYILKITAPRKFSIER